jgi:hypothetical protein
MLENAVAVAGGATQVVGDGGAMTFTQCENTARGFGRFDADFRYAFQEKKTATSPNRPCHVSLAAARNSAFDVF